MERLTFDGNFCEIAQCRELPCQYGGSCSQRKVWERLKAYEDTGLTPEDVVPVVRCKDCRHSYEDIGGLTCSRGICVDCIVRRDFFCADGAKREAADD